MKPIWSGALACAVASTAFAQGPILQPKLAEVQPAKFSVPLCPLKPEGKTSKGVEALRKSYDPKADKAAQLKLAHELITQALAEGQGSSAAAWYYLARVYLMQGDVGGVDSAFARAVKLQPQCELDIDQQRQNNWAQLATAAFELQKNNETEQAIVLFRDASRLFNERPEVVANLGVLFANSQQDDSAAAYFAKALAIAEKGAEADTSMIESRNSSALNLAIMLQRTNKAKEAVPVLQKYLSWDPANMDARKSLSQAFRDAGMADSASALDNAMIAEMSKQNLDSLDMQDLMAIGVSAFNAQKYQEAATAFGKASVRNPYSRDAVYNLANAYLALKENDKLVETASRLAEIEPMNEDVYRLIGQGQKALKKDVEVLKAAEKLVGLPLHIEMAAFAIGRSAAKLEGVARGRAPTDAQGKAIKVTAVTLVVEFVTTAGTVVDTKEVAVPQLATGAEHKISIDAKGQNIAGWRYRAR
ncbi:MAG: tetratricopeptide repeat protein [Gemmatimonadetes bacterium]|nr:tetratricopeptide repeat protein [Gemmatimonadota bacterium]